MEGGLNGGYPQRPFSAPPDATEVLLVRHGASAPAVPGEPFPLRDGHADPPLAAEGEHQARALARRLAGEPIAAVFVSGLRRTVQTAAVLGSSAGVRPTVVPELREVGLGAWEGGEWRIRLAQRDPLALRVLAEERWDVIPQAESMESLGRRVRAGVEAVVAVTGAGAQAVVVTHGGVIGELCRQATASRAFAFVHADNASISRLVVFGDGRWLLRSFNETAHLG